MSDSYRGDDPLDNFFCDLAAMCFPVSFPAGNRQMS